VGLGPRDVALDVALNDATSDQALRGQPLLVLGVAVLTEEVSEPRELDSQTVGLRVVDQEGDEQDFPFWQLSSLPDAVVLEAEQPSVRVFFGLSAEQTSQLVAGSYQLQLIWGERASPTLPLELVDPPDELEPSERRRLYGIEAQHALLEGDSGRALEATQAGLDEQPDDIGLLVLQARAHEADGALEGALQSLEAAIGSFEEQFPDASHPPVSLLELRRTLLDRAVAEEEP
jgi:hypothetical protein